MKTIKLLLSKAIRIKEALERSIDEDIIVLASNSTVTDIVKVERVKEVKSYLLRLLHILIQKANTEKLSWRSKYPNNYWIKLKSELRRDKTYLQSINVDKKRKKNQYLSDEEVTAKIREIEKKSTECYEEMERFNNSKVIKLKLTPSQQSILNDFIKSI